MKKTALLFILFFFLPSVSAYYHHDSPIHWKEYNQEAFDLALREDKPVFMVISAIWCYWCHQYRDETLHDPAVSKYVNEHFIPVFVDADQRQDVTRQYLAGGWPSTVIFDKHGNEVKRINGHIRKEDLLDYLQKVVAYFQANDGLSALKEEDFSRPLQFPSENELLLAVNNYPAFLLSQMDAEYGGFQGEKKFPEGRALLFLLEHYERSGDGRYLAAVEKSLQGIAQAEYIKDGLNYGLFDPVEGGFHRYATEQDWSRPHYEKMLVDQARMIQAYLKAYELTGNGEYKDIAEKALAYVLDNLHDPGTAFYGSQDADEEYYKLSLGEREKHGKPKIDTTIYSDWNGEMIAAFVDASLRLKREDLLRIAVDAGDFFLGKMVTENGVMHYYDGKAKLDGLTLDNAWVITAFLKLYGATNDVRFLDAARSLQEYALVNLYDPVSGGFIERNSKSLGLYPAGKESYGVHPYGANGVMALNLLKLYEITQDGKYLRYALETLGYSLADSGSLSDSVFYVDASRYLLEHGIHPEAFVKKPDVRSPLENVPFLSLFVIAFVAGLLSFFSPCCLPVIPAYFASAFQHRRRVVLRHTVAFSLGLALVFSALGASATVLGSFLVKHSLLFSRVAGVLVLLFGFYLLLGKGFSGVPLRLKMGRSLLGSLGFGVGFGVSWTPCIGPILAGLLILAGNVGHWYSGAFLLVVYSLGFAVPLILLSLFFDRLSPDGLFWRVVRGRMFSFRFLGIQKEVHSTYLFAGVLFIVLGFLMMNGYLFVLNKYVLTTGFQRAIFGLEEKVLSFLVG